MTFFLIASVCSFNQTAVMFRTVDSWHIRDSLVYNTYSGFSLSDEEKQAELDKILSVSGVQDANAIKVYTLYFPEIEEGSGIRLLDYSDSMLFDVRYSLLEGSYPSKDQINAILLPFEFHDTYEVGDVLDGYTYPPMHTLNTPEMPISVTVAGFLEDQPVLEPNSDSYLNSIFTRHIDRRECNAGVLYHLEDIDGNPISPDFSDFFLVRSDGSLPIEKLKESISTVIMSPGLLRTGNEIVEEYIEENKEEIGETISLCITSCILSFSILTASTLLEFIYRKKEMACLYLCGTSWSSCVWIVLARQILPIVIGFPIGLLLFANVNQLHLFLILEPRLELTDVLVVLILQIIFVALAIIPFRLSTKYKTPYELFRKD